MRGRRARPTRLDKARHFQLKQGFADAGGLAQQTGAADQKPGTPGWGFCRAGLRAARGLGARARALVRLGPTLAPSERALAGSSPGDSSNPSPWPQGPQAPDIARARGPRVPAEPPKCRSPRVVVKLAHRKGLWKQRNCMK